MNLVLVEVVKSIKTVVVNNFKEDNMIELTEYKLKIKEIEEVKKDIRGYL